MTNPAALNLPDPLDIDDARVAARRLAEKRREAEVHYRKAIEDAADAKREYHKEYAKAIIKAEGTAAVKEALAKAEAADARYFSDLADGYVKAQQEVLKTLEGERSMLKSLIDMSAKMRIDENDQARGGA